MAAPHPPAGGTVTHTTVIYRTPGAKAKDESQRSALRPPTAEEKKTWARSPMPEAKPEGDKALPNCISCFPDVVSYYRSKIKDQRPSLTDYVSAREQETSSQSGDQEQGQ